MHKTLLILDGHSLAYRAFYALPALTNKEGITTNAIYGFLKMLNRLLDDLAPDFLTIAFDTAKPTFRHLAFKEYKAQRKPSPQEFYTQIPFLQEILNKAGAKVLTFDGFEADDIIATSAKLAKKSELRVKIVTGDKDLLQLVSENISILIPQKGLSVLNEFNLENFFQKTNGLNPNQIVDFKSIKGDSSDNIKGIIGIGDVSALKVIKEQKSLENIFKQEDSQDKLIKKIIEHKELVAFNQKLCRLVDNIPFSEDELWSLAKLNLKNAEDILKKLNINFFFNKKDFEADKPKNQEEQMSLL